LTRSEVELGELLRTMIDLYEPSMSEKGLQIRLHAAGEVKVFADASLLHRMIANLLDNELKHLPNSCAVTVEVKAQEDSAWLTLQDNGPGFDDEVLEHVCERRVKGRESNGHGLGLAFVDAVARAHGGSVAVRNREGSGAEITVALPLARQKPVEYAVAAAANAG